MQVRSHAARLMCQRLQKSVRSHAANGLLKFSGTVTLHSFEKPIQMSEKPEKLRKSQTPAAKAKNQALIPSPDWTTSIMPPDVDKRIEL